MKIFREENIAERIRGLRIIERKTSVNDTVKFKLSKNKFFQKNSASAHGRMTYNRLKIKLKSVDSIETTLSNDGMHHACYF